MHVFFTIALLTTLVRTAGQYVWMVSCCSALLIVACLCTGQFTRLACRSRDQPWPRDMQVY